jgi:protein-export membrane protein SecD
MIKTRAKAVGILIIGCVIGYFVYASEHGAFGTKTFRLGLDLAGGTHLVYTADVSKVPAGQVHEAMSALRDVIERRVNLFNVSEPLVQVEEGGLLGAGGAERLVVELPGVTDIDEAVKQIGSTPLLDFRLLTKEGKAILASTSTTPAEKQKMMDIIFAPTGLAGGDLKSAQVVFDQTTGQPSVQLHLTSQGAELFAKITREHIGDTLGIFLDGRDISLPTIRQEIKNGTAIISGSFNVDEAKELVRNLNYGALPVPISLTSTQTVGASLGADALHGGIRAGLWAFLIVAIFLVVWYRVPGMVAVLALGVYSAIMLALFKLIPVTLTAAGIAGFILSIGMAVDANILIFERMKEELARGLGLAEAMHEGFARAWLSIRDSNLSSLITGGILFYFGTSAIVKGFALVFVIGVLVSMFSAITASRLFLYAVAPWHLTSRFGRFVFSSGFFTRKK